MIDTFWKLKLLGIGYLILSSCGTWAGNPPGFGGDGKSNKPVTTSQPVPDDNIQTDVPIVFNISGVENGILINTEKDGTTSQFSLKELTVSIKTIELGNEAFTTVSKNLLMGSAELGTTKQSELNSLILTWNTPSLLIQASLGDKTLLLPIDLSTIVSTMNFSKTNSIKNKVIVQLEMGDLLNFKGRKTSLGDFSNLDFTNSVGLAKTFLDEISVRINNKLSAGIDENGDGLLNTDEISGELTKLPDLIKKEDDSEDD